MRKIFLESSRRRISYTEESGELKISIRVRRQDALIDTSLSIWFCGWIALGIKGMLVETALE
jgi:hypothetical protein